MADILLNRIINDEINTDVFIRWLVKVPPENEECIADILTSNVAQIDFITYFLNYVHEQVHSNIKHGDTPQKLNAPKQIDKIQAHTAREQNISLKSNLFTNQNNSTPEQICSPNSSINVSIGKYSTPKVNRNGPNKNDSYFSPISPLYQNQNSFSSREVKNENGAKKSADKYSLCLGDFIVNSSKSSSKKKRLSIEPTEDKKEASRRIKPTSIFPKQNINDFQKTENSFNFQDNNQDIAINTATEQRNLLVEERNKILSRKDSLEKNSQNLLAKRCNSLSKSEITPTLNNVTFKNQIDNIVTIYETILRNKMVLNITSEIYFLISLLLSKHSDSFTQTSRYPGKDNSFEELNFGVAYLDQSKPTECTLTNDQKTVKTRLYNSELFETIHNVVYFSVRCLETQLEILKLYDRTTIRLLADNERLKSFSQSFSKKLLVCAAERTEKASIEPSTPIFQTNVCFIAETDNKENFPDQSSFHAFRKQRDLFYEILKVWETYHLSPDWSFSMRLGGKIKSLFSLNCEPTNYVHMARLFKNQLLGNCVKGTKETGLVEGNLSFMPSVAIDADKLNRLTNRLVTKQSSSGINSVPTFTGYQEFYRDFIVVASNHFFNRHLSDSLISEIVELNDLKFSGIDIEEQENDVDTDTVKRYLKCIKNLRILAKFLGFIESLPYKSEILNLSKNVLESQISIRSQCMPALDVKILLNVSIEKNSLVLLIPWLTIYLAMLDYVTVRLPYYQEINKILFSLYHNYNILEKHKYNMALIRFCLGWLFELPHFPESEYFYFCLKSDEINCSTDENVLKNLHISNGLNGTKIQLKSKALDQLNIANQSVLYLCCPYLEEIKKLLLTNASSSNISVKYITPVSAVESNSEMARKKLEQQLEDAFFNGQPSSLRKTIEFVSERIASLAVKHVCHDLVPKAKDMAMKDLKENLLKNDTPDMYSDDIQRKTLLKKKATSLAQDHLSTFLQTCNQEIQKISIDKIGPSIDSLLPIDTLEETKNVCVGIADKMYTERVRQWLNSHVTLSLFMKDFDSEVQKLLFFGKRGDKEKVPFLLPSSGRDCAHNEDSLSGFHLLNTIREACCDLTENINVDEEFVVNLLRKTHKSLTERNDINDMITAIICNTLFDFCLLLVSKSPNMFTVNLQIMELFKQIWSHQHKSSNPFKALFCPRNIILLQQSSCVADAWKTYAKIIACLIECKLIENDDIESQCTGFYNKEWNQETLESFSAFLKLFISYCKRDNDNTDGNFAYLLDFLSDFCSDL